MIELTEVAVSRRAGGKVVDWSEAPLLLNPRHIVSARPLSRHEYPGAVYEVTLVTGAAHDVIGVIGYDPSAWAEALSDG